MTCPHCKNDDPKLLERLLRGWLCHVCSKEFADWRRVIAGMKY